MDTTRLMLPVTAMHVSPPTGRAISGSMEMPAMGRSASSTITTRGPMMAGRKPGSALSLVSMSLWATARPFFFLERNVASSIAMARAKSAGTMFLNIREVRSTPKASEGR